MTQRELAEPLYTHAYVSTVEAGRRYPSREALGHFSSRLGVELDELITGRPPDLAARLALAIHEARHAVSQGEFDRCQRTLRGVFREASQYGFHALTAQAKCVQALVRERAGEPEAAIKAYEEAEELLKGEPVFARAEAVAGQGRCHHMLGDIRFAIHLLESFRDDLQREELVDPDALVRVTSPLVLAYLDAQLFERASEVASEVLRLSQRAQNPANIAAMHVNVARVLLHQGRYVQAERSLRRAEGLYRHVDYRAELGVAHLAQGYVLLRRGDLDRAEAQLMTARIHLRRSRSRVNEAHAINELARAARLRNRVDEAERLLRTSLRILEDGSDLSGLAWARRELGHCRAGTDPAGAEKSYRAAIELYEHGGEGLQVAATYRSLGDLLLAQERLDAALDAYRSGICAIEEDL